MISEIHASTAGAISSETVAGGVVPYAHLQTDPEHCTKAAQSTFWCCSVSCSCKHADTCKHAQVHLTLPRPLIDLLPLEEMVKMTAHQPARPVVPHGNSAVACSCSRDLPAAHRYTIASHHPRTCCATIATEPPRSGSKSCQSTMPAHDVAPALASLPAGAGIGHWQCLKLRVASSIKQQHARVHLICHGAAQAPLSRPHRQRGQHHPCHHLLQSHPSSTASTSAPAMRAQQRHDTAGHHPPPGMTVRRRSGGASLPLCAADTAAAACALPAAAAALAGSLRGSIEGQPQQPALHIGLAVRGRKPPAAAAADAASAAASQVLVQQHGRLDAAGAALVQHSLPVAHLCSPRAG